MSRDPYTYVTVSIDSDEAPRVGISFYTPGLRVTSGVLDSGRPFLDFEVGNEVTLAFLDAEDMEVQMQHYAFLVSEQEFDAIFGRVKERGLKYWADPGMKQEGEINRHYGL